MNVQEAIAHIRKEEKRKFNQTIDLLINLKGIDLKRENVSLIATIPHNIKEKKVCGFFEAKNDLVKTITKPEFDKYKEKKALRSLVRDYDFFIANTKLMPSVAAAFGKALGPAGKMPSPQLGIINDEQPGTIKNVLHKIASSVKIRAKEPSIKVAIGTEKMSDQQLGENILAIYNAVMNALPSKKDNIKNVMIKLTMGAPVKVDNFA